MIKDERPVVLHSGIYKRTATTAEAVFMITGMTIGAGVLALPYTVSRIGLWRGIVLIIILGFVNLILQLLLGEIAIRTKEHMQLPGFAGKYLGAWAKVLISITIILRAFGTLLAYVVGAGVVLAALLGGSSLGWSIIFWSLGSILIWAGLQRVKSVEKWLSLLVMIIIIGISFFILPHSSAINWQWSGQENILLAIGVILFALSGTPAIAEAHALLPGSERHFKRAVILGSLIPVAIYLLFVIAVVGVFGLNTTEVATLGLGAKFGPNLVFFANLFAIMAMSTAFMGLGTALKETFVWDHKFPALVATMIVCLVPLSLFLLGWRGFVVILEVVGGVFIALENIIMILVYFKAHKHSEIIPRYYNLRIIAGLGIIVLAFFILVAGFNLFNIFSSLKLI